MVAVMLEKTFLQKEQQKEKVIKYKSKNERHEKDGLKWCLTSTIGECERIKQTWHLKRIMWKAHQIPTTESSGHFQQTILSSLPLPLLLSYFIFCKECSIFGYFKSCANLNNYHFC